MQKIDAIITPFKLDDVVATLRGIGISGMTVTPEVRGFGRQKGRVEVFHGAEISIPFIPKIKIEVVVIDSVAEKVISAIQQKTKTGTIGDGKIFVTRLVEVVRIRTGERGDTAI